MAASVTTTTQKRAFATHRRQRIMGLIFLGFAAAIWYFFGRTTDPEFLTTFKLVPGGIDSNIEPWEFSTISALNTAAFVSAFIGAGQLARGFGKRTNSMLGVVAGLFIFSFLAWAAADKSLNVAGLFNTTLSKAVPITLGALSGILSERAGVVNIAIEGMMLSGAMVGSTVASLLRNRCDEALIETVLICGGETSRPYLWIGIFAAVLAGALLAYVHGLFSIKYMIDQIISGTVINIFSVGITSFLDARFLQEYQYLNSPGTFRAFEIPVLSQIPLIGPIVFRNNIFVYLMFLLLITLHLALFYTRWGLRVRAVGEHPRAADTLGINVIRTRYMAVVMSGMMAGFGGAYFTLGSVGRFDEAMTAGRGFIGLAAMLFGNYSPFGAFGAGLLFGFADSLASKLAILKIAIPSQFLLMAPYIITMVVLAGVVGRSQMPAADGQPYSKEGH
ncbi:MAG: ABC transporter permease [Candidatus Promineifilaceae bacterium]